MHVFRVPPTRGAVPALFVLLLGLNSCGGGSSSLPLKPVSSPLPKPSSSPPPQPSYSLAATAFASASVIAGNTTTSTITLTPTGGYSGAVTLSCSAMSGANARVVPSALTPCPSVAPLRPHSPFRPPSTRPEATTLSPSPRRTPSMLCPPTVRNH